MILLLVVVSKANVSHLSQAMKSHPCDPRKQLPLICLSMISVDS